MHHSHVYEDRENGIFNNWKPFTAPIADRCGVRHGAIEYLIESMSICILAAARMAGTSCRPTAHFESTFPLDGFYYQKYIRSQAVRLRDQRTMVWKAILTCLN
jgi:hypothetical protein